MDMNNFNLENEMIKLYIKFLKEAERKRNVVSFIDNGIINDKLYRNNFINVHLISPAFYTKILFSCN
jgi:hypothetical protein